MATGRFAAGSAPSHSNRRANAILYVDVTHRKIIGKRSDSAATAQKVLATVLQRLG